MQGKFFLQSCHYDGIVTDPDLQQPHLAPIPTAQQKINACIDYRQPMCGRCQPPAAAALSSTSAPTLNRENQLISTLLAVALPEQIAAKTLTDQLHTNPACMVSESMHSSMPLLHSIV
jgi:hypothetical protein